MGDKRHALEDCTLDILDGCNATILPNSVQLVESKVPLSEADNCEKLKGVYLFRQIFSSSNNRLQCLFCRNKYSFSFPSDLERHYEVIHGLAVNTSKAEFNANIVFVCVPSNINEETTVNSGCRFCNTTLKTLAEVRDHYPNAHNKTVRFVPESDVTQNGKFFYCGLCGHASAEFQSHHEHMKVMHRMKTDAVCPYCTYCTSRPSSLKTHVKQKHLKDQSGPNLQCSVCSVYVNGKDRMTKHIMLFHVVKTGQKTWSCAKCLYPYGDLHELMTHIPKCPKLQSSSEKHMAGEHIGVSGSSEEVASTSVPQENYDPSNMAKITCFLCCMRFSSPEIVRKHQHHVHMCWVTKGSTDYSKVEFSGENEGEIGQAINEIQSNSVLEMSLNQNDPASAINNLEQFELNVKINGQQIFAQGTTEIADKTSVNQPSAPPVKKESDISKEYNRLGDFDISLDDLPDDKELAEMGFPTKLGHFCHLCDTVIKSYHLYYFHMYNFHQLEKRFQCTITACGRTFSTTAAYQKHAINHNQKGEHYCSMCDNVFGDDEELQDHLISLDHANKYMQFQEKYRRAEPRNHRCNVCYSWFGLFATFVKHMETESHSYQCPECGALFYQPGPRRNHIQSNHPEVADISEC